MNISRLVYCLEFIVESQELRELGLNEKEIEGYFCFNWDLGTDLITSMLERGTNDKH